MASQIRLNDGEYIIRMNNLKSEIERKNNYFKIK